MGRDKSQRTKGNAKPASSDRTAQLLGFPQSGAGSTAAGFGFSGFSTGSGPGGTGAKPTFESLAGTASYVPILDDSLDPKFALPLRKLGKKDPTTKIKALSELITLCKEDSSVPPQILPFYPSIYTKLSIDESKKVRELAQSLLQVISTSVGRTLATQLKQILPSWYLSINDTFPPAASVALNSFKIIFPTEEKQIQTLKFCLTEIGELVKERIFSREEFEKITGLEGLKKILHIVENDYVFGILKDDRFWALAKDDFGQIRSSFYSLLSRLGETHAELIPKSKLTKALTTALREEKFELSSLWDCFITLTTNGIFNEKEIARKELLVLCRNSFYGNAVQLGPLVLPLVHKIEQVGEELFGAIEEGFEGSSSNSEKLAIIRTYAESLAYFLKDGNQLPASTIIFLTSNLKQACEFGRTISPMLKTNASLYTALIDALSGSADADAEPLPKEYGNFILSFLERRKCVSFDEPPETNIKDAESSSVACTTAYENLPEAKRNFTKSIAKRLLELHAFKPFSVLSRAMKCAEFYSDVLDLAQIPSIFHSRALNEDSKLEVLRIALDLVQIFPNAPTSLLLLSTVYDKYFSGEGSDLEPFLRELSGFDELKPIRKWLRMDLFTQRESPSVLKYILRKGSTFPEALVQGKVQQLCERFDPDTVRDLLLSHSKTDLTSIYLKAFQLYLSDKTEDLETLCHLIMERDVLSKRKVYELLLNGLVHCATVAEINHLVESFALRVVDVDDVELFKVNPVDCGSIDADFLVFHGFKYPKLQYPSGIAAWGQFNPMAAIKQVMFEAKIAIALASENVDFTQLGMNLILTQCLYSIWDEAIGLPKIAPQFTEELTSCQAKIIEKIAEDKKVAKDFWAQLLVTRENEVWASKFPIKYFLKLAKKMELTCFTFPNVSHPTSLDNIQAIVQEYLLDSKVSGSELVTILENERNDNAEQFQFEKLFGLTNDVQRQRMFDLLTLTSELMQRNPEFLTNATCWISAWVRMGKNIQPTKTNYLWIIELCRAIITIDRLVKDVKGLGDFVQEYVEFHAQNLYPNIYAWVDQLLVNVQAGQAQVMDCWRLKAGEVALTALALAPRTVFTFHVEQDSDVIFTKFVPILRRPEMRFKMGAYKILKKVTVKDDIIIPKELLSYLEVGVPKDVENEAEETRNGNQEASISYLLAWDVLLACQPNTADLANFVKCDEYLPRLLSLIFLKWIPQHPKQYFETEFRLTTSTTVPQLACHVLRRVLSCLPYTVRWWWTGLLKQRDKVLVEKIITKHLSGKLASEELSKVKLDKESDHITVLSHPGCNELVARYKFEETSVTLTISLPLNYPLGPVSVQVSDQKLHARISQLLNSRSHSLSAGLKLWKETLDDTYKDVDECTICFYVIHHATKQLPKLDCRTCRKKFHSACLYKWFSTSNKSECPLCKSLW